MAISGHAVVAILGILLKLAIMAWLNMAIHMVNMGVYAKSRLNVDSLLLLSQSRRVSKVRR